MKFVAVTREGSVVFLDGNSGELLTLYMDFAHFTLPNITSSSSDPNVGYCK